MGWHIRSTAEYDRWFEELPEEEQAEMLAKVALLRDYGPHLGRPHADRLHGSAYPNMKELRGMTADAQLRAAFAFDPQRIGILLIGGAKQGVHQRRFYKALVAVADKLFARHLRASKT